MARRCCYLLLIATTLTAPATPNTATADEKPRQGTESWYSIEFEGRRAGYEWVRTARLPKPTTGNRSTTPDLLRRERRTLLQLQRAGAKVSLAAVLVSQETPEGLLQNWELTRTGADGSRIHRRGAWDATHEAMKIEDPDNADQPPLLVPSPSQPYSPIFTEWLGSATAAADFPRIVQVLFPESAIAADVEIQIAGKSPLELPDGSRISARRLSWEPTAAPQLRTRIFLAASDGQCLLVEQPLLGGTLRLVRSTPEEALGLDSEQTLDLQLQSLLPVTGQIPASPPESGVRLKLTTMSPSPFTLAETDFQHIESQASNGLIVICRSVNFSTTEQSLLTTRRRRNPDGDEFLSASKWIDHTAPAVKRLLAATGERSGTPAETCRQLSAFVNRRMQFSAFTTQLQPASRVAAKLLGDCTEHTVLLCALLRSRGIPARAASGFVYVPQLSAFAPHLWTEALVDGSWLPLDSTIPPEAAFPLLLKVGDSPLGDDLSGSVALFAPLLPLCGQVEISVLSEN
ncbi:MAG: hypothetical protein RLZZ436_212 [Planctomycetota bacterium]